MIEFPPEEKALKYHAQCLPATMPYFQILVIYKLSSFRCEHEQCLTSGTQALFMLPLKVPLTHFTSEQIVYVEIREISNLISDNYTKVAWINISQLFSVFPMHSHPELNTVQWRCYILWFEYPCFLLLFFFLFFMIKYPPQR